MMFKSKAQAKILTRGIRYKTWPAHGVNHGAKRGEMLGV